LSPSELGGVTRRGAAQSEVDLKAIVDLAMKNQPWVMEAQGAGSIVSTCRPSIGSAGIQNEIPCAGFTDSRDGAK